MTNPIYIKVPVVWRSGAAEYSLHRWYQRVAENAVCAEVTAPLHTSLFVQRFPAHINVLQQIRVELGLPPW